MGLSNKPPQTSTQSSKRKKKTSVFDEYENRGDVLEEYENLNSDNSGDDDLILGQMVD